MTVDSLSGRFPPNALRVKSANGAWLQTDHGAQVDYLLGNCCNVLGHAEPHVVEKLQTQIALGTNWGDHVSDAALDLGARIAGIAGLDSVRLVSSGSEAVHLALRAARAATGRSRVIKFDGHYHGWFAEEISKFISTDQYMPGLVPGSGSTMSTLQWNDSASLIEWVDNHGSDLAAIICEPVFCHAGTVPPDAGFLALLRDLCDKTGALLVFDECITGFRISLGGAQEHYGVKADLVSYSKAISAGIPIGIVAGTAQAMQPLTENSAYQAATYDANALSVAAASAVLDVLEEGSAYDRIAKHGTELQRQMSAILKQYGVAHTVQGFPSVFQIFYTEEGSVRDRPGAFATDLNFHVKLTSTLNELGVNAFPGDLNWSDAEGWSGWLAQWFVSAAHGDDELNFTLERFAKAVPIALDLAGREQRPLR